jgi:hypothetical protein
MSRTVNNKVRERTRWENEAWTKMASTGIEHRSKWRVEFNEARDSDLPSKLEPIGYCRGITAEKVQSPYAT